LKAATSAEASLFKIDHIQFEFAVGGTDALEKLSCDRRLEILITALAGSATFAEGQTLHFCDIQVMSAFHPIVTKSRGRWHFDFGPISDKERAC